MGAQGVSALPLLVVEHPLGGERPQAIARRAQQAFEQLSALISGAGAGTKTRATAATAAAPAGPPGPPPTDPTTGGGDPVPPPDRFSARTTGDRPPATAPP